MLRPSLRKYLNYVILNQRTFQHSCSCLPQFCKSPIVRHTSNQTTTHQPSNTINNLANTRTNTSTDNTSETLHTHAHKNTTTVTITESDLPPQPTSNNSDYSSSLLPLDPMDEADTHLADLNFKLAIEKYSEAIQKNILPVNVPLEEAYSRRAQCYHRLRKFKEARQDCEKILDISDKPYFMSEAYKRIGDTIIDQEEFSDGVTKVEAATRAAPYYHKALALLPDEETFYALGNALLTVRQFKLAQRAFKDAIRLDKDFAPAYQGRAEAFIGQEMWPQAKDDYEEFLHLQEDYFASFTPGEQVDINAKSAICQAHLKLAVINVELMEPEEVKKHCQEILEINHLFVAQAYGFIARALFMEGKFWECIDSCTEALKRDATLFRVFKVRSSAYEQLGLVTEAKSDDDAYQFMIAKKQTKSYRDNMELQIRLQKLAEIQEK